MPIPYSAIRDILGAAIGDSSPTPNPQYLDENGNPVNGQLPYTPPGFGTKMFHPDVAAQIGNLNNQVYNAQLSGRANVAKTKTEMGDTVNEFQNPQTAPNVITSLGSQNALNQNIAAESSRLTGAPKTIGTLSGLADMDTARSNLIRSKFNLTQQPTTLTTEALGNVSALQTAQRVLDRQDVVDATKDQQAVNQLHDETKAEPLRIQDAINQLRGHLGRDPKFQELQDYLMSSQLSESKVGEALGKTKESMIPDITNTLKKHLLGEEYEAHFLPMPTTPFANRITDEGNISTGVRSDYHNMMDMISAKVNGNKEDEIPGVKTSTGQPLPKLISARTGVQTTAANSIPTIGQPLGAPIVNSTNVPSVTANTNGVGKSSMIPSISNMDASKPAQIGGMSDISGLLDYIKKSGMLDKLKKRWAAGNLLGQ